MWQIVIVAVAETEQQTGTFLSLLGKFLTSR
jgi:hypothetical protein